jgi:hypothetical protein
MDRGSYGMTHGDGHHLGLRDYNQPYPCPNGLPIDTRRPGDCEHWRKRVDKAKRDIEHSRFWAGVQSCAEEFTDEQIFEDLEIIRTWARSLQRTAQPIGSAQLTQVGKS